MKAVHSLVHLDRKLTLPGLRHRLFDAGRVGLTRLTLPSPTFYIDDMTLAVAIFREVGLNRQEA